MHVEFSAPAFVHCLEIEIDLVVIIKAQSDARSQIYLRSCKFMAIYHGHLCSRLWQEMTQQYSVPLHSLVDMVATVYSRVLMMRTEIDIAS